MDKNVTATIWTGIGVVLASGGIGWGMYAHLDDKLSADRLFLESKIDAGSQHVDTKFDKLVEKLDKLSDKVDEMHDVMLVQSVRLENIEMRLGIRRGTVGQEHGAGSAPVDKQQSRKK